MPPEFDVLNDEIAEFCQELIYNLTDLPEDLNDLYLSDSSVNYTAEDLV